MSETVAATDDQKARAAVAYILMAITGLIIFFTAKREDHYARWHAVQAIGLGIFFFVVSIILNFFFTVMAFGSGGWMGGGVMMGGLFGFGGILWLLVIIVVVIMAVKAYQGETIRLPVLAEFADKYA